MVTSGLQINITRITADIDDREWEHLSRCINVFISYGFDKDIEIIDSPSGRGYHVICWSQKGVPKEELIKIRRAAGDDSNRCNLDERTGRHIQVLFDEKKKSRIE